jgi:hypothetical protein
MNLLFLREGIEMQPAITVGPSGKIGQFRLSPRIAAGFAILLARGAAHTQTATQHPTAAALGLLWITADALMLALMVGSVRNKPTKPQILATLCAAAVLTWVNASTAMRTAIAGSPVLSSALLGIVLLHLAAGSGLAVQAWQRSHNKAFADRLEIALAQLLPASVVRLARAELRIMTLALFRWRSEPDVPADCVGFAYHRYLAPQLWVLLCIVSIEAFGEHILIRHWNAVAGTVLAVISDVGLIYMIGLIKSLRLCPILLTPDGVRVRAGYLIDRVIPYAQIAQLRPLVSGDDVRAATCWNMGLLAWPNVMFDLNSPLPHRNLLRGNLLAITIAFRVDQPAEFTRLLSHRLTSAAA